MTKETRDEIRDHLFQKLAETAESSYGGGVRPTIRATQTHGETHR